MIKINSSSRNASDYEAWYQLNGRLQMPCAAIVTVDCRPGYCETGMLSTVSEPVWQKIVAKILVQCLGHPADVAGAIVFLAARDTGFITGATLSGGQ